jgi:exosortase D (VPLPA-CTERM-specific)
MMLVAALLGLALVIFGYGALRILLPLAVLLALAIPLPYTLEAILTIKLQLLSTNIGVALIQLIGVPVYVEGNIIDLGTYKLQVAEACSGLRYLLPLICISFLVAYLYKATFWKKAFLVVSAAPITILINSFRIAVTAVLVNSFGIEMAEGFLHQFEGWIIFILGLLVLGLEILVLERFRWSKVELAPIMSRSGSGARPIVPFRLDLPLVITVLVCAATFGVTSSVASAMRSAPIPVRDSFSGFPRDLGDWTGQPTELDAATLGLLRPTDYYLGDFAEKPSDVPVNFYSVYYNSLAEGAAIHSPRVCLPGAGWEFASLQERKFSELAPGVAGTYTYAVIQKGEQKILMYYWYQQRQRRTASEFWMKYYLLVDNLFTSRTDGGLVRLDTPIIAADGDRGEAKANARLQNFAQTLFPKLPSYLPQ